MNLWKKDPNCKVAIPKTPTKPIISIDEIEEKPTKVFVPLEKPKEEFTLIKQNMMCNQYHQLSTSSQSVETCSELVKGNDKCSSGHGHFFYGEVNANHKECACCLGAADKIQESKMRANANFSVYQLHHDEAKEKQDATDDNFKLSFKYRECGAQSRNFGPIRTPEACASVAVDNQCESFMFSHKYPVWGCRCCAKAEGGRPHRLWNVYTVDEDFSRSKKAYYTMKAKFDAVKEIIEKGKDQIMEDELKTNVVKLDTNQTVSIENAIKKYKYYRPSRGKP